MRTCSLERAGIRLSRLGLGTWSTGAGRGGSSHLGPQDDDESVGAIHRALDHGINWIDTAAYYGFGHAERIVARALRGMTDRPYVFTKCGLIPGPGGRTENRITAGSVRAEAEDSLRRLETEVLDLLMIHWPVPDRDVEEGWSTVLELKEEGKVRLVGVSNFSGAQMERCERLGPIDVAQPEYSLVERSAEVDVLPYGERHGIGAVVYSPLKHGLLSGTMTRERAAAFTATDWRNGHTQFVEPSLSQNLALVEVLRSIGKRHDRSVAEIAVAWTVRRENVAGAIVGARRGRQVDGIVGAADVHLEDDDLREIAESLP